MYPFFFFFFCSIAGHTVELNPEGEWMEKMQSSNGFMNDSVCWIKQIWNRVILLIISVSSYYPWFDPMKLWIFETIEHKWGLDVRRQLPMGKIESSKYIFWSMLHFLICNIGILQSISALCIEIGNGKHNCMFFLYHIFSYFFQVSAKLRQLNYSFFDVTETAIKDL